MEKFEKYSGIPVPLRRSNVDTDQIIPAVYLKRISRTGFEDGLFAAWRQDPEFVLNQEPYDKGSILIAGPDFGTGSSREHAVWALQNYGFKAVIGSRFGDIFRNNAGKAGLVVAVVEQPVVEELWEFAEANPGARITVDLLSKIVLAGQTSYPFQIPDFTRTRILEGLDDIAITLQREDEIAEFERKRPSWKPKTLPVKTMDTQASFGN